jgi:hypothetical protein
MSIELVPGLGPFITAALSVAVVPEGDLQGQTFPLIAVQDVGASSDPTFDQIGWQTLRLQFGCYAPQRGPANDLRSRLRTLLEGFRGQLPNGLFLEDVEFATQSGAFDEGLRQHRALIDLRFKFNM